VFNLDDVGSTTALWTPAAHARSLQYVFDLPPLQCSSPRCPAPRLRRVSSLFSSRLRGGFPA
jgi:hypothetical protein